MAHTRREQLFVLLVDHVGIHTSRKSFFVPLLRFLCLGKELLNVDCGDPPRHPLWWRVYQWFDYAS
jgi:hypothetical protein